MRATEVEVLREFARDLSTCTEAEIRQRWSASDQELLERIAPGEFAKRLENHNPIYYLAEQVYFDNVKQLSPERAQKFLYPPLHRDRFAQTDLDYYFSPQETSAGLITLMPRGSYKSSFRHGAVPLWIALREWHLNKYHAHLALIHQLEDKASANLMRLKSKTLSHGWFRATWPEFCSEKDYGTKTEFTWAVAPKSIYASEPSVIARGIGADLTGFHFDHIFFSDLVVAKHAVSQQERTMTKKRHDALLYTLLTGKPWYDGTRYHVRDLYGDMISANVDGEKLYTLMRVKAIEDDGTLSLPLKYSYKVLEHMRQKEISRTGNDLMWHLQMQCDVRSSHAIAADLSWIKYVPMTGVKSTGFRVITVDPAWKGTANAGEGDFASIQVWSLERVGAFVVYTLLDGVHSNELTDDDGVAHIFRLMGRYAVQHVAPEERGGYSFRTKLKNEGISRGRSISVIDLETMQRGWDMRVAAFLGHAQAGRVRVANECNPDLKESFLGQFADYPQLDHDDALDAAAYVCDPAIAGAYAPMFGIGEEDENSFFAMFDEGEYVPRTRHCIN